MSVPGDTGEYTRIGTKGLCKLLLTYRLCGMFP